MRILYGVVGEGLGHATRSRVVLEHLLALGHQVRVVVSGKAHQFLVDRFAGRPDIRFEEIRGFTVAYEGNAIDPTESFWKNLEKAPETLLHNAGVWWRVVTEGWEPDLVISDFESWAYFYGLNHQVPVVSIDNIQVLARCRHAPEMGGDLDAFLALAAVKVKVPGAWHYLVTSFFFPPVKKRRTTLVPPILRPQILEARPEPGDHVVVYRTATSPPDLVDMLRRLPGRFLVYGGSSEGCRENVEHRPFSETGFVEDLRTARGVVAAGGFSLMSEAVHLGVPMFCIPIGGQHEQELNARYLASLGYGAWSPFLDWEPLTLFLQNLDTHAHALASYPRQDNSMALACVEELLERRSRGEDPPERLQSPSMGSWAG